MNILFYHWDETCPTMGGIQRTTASIAESLMSHGHKCYSIYDYENPYPEDVERYKYSASRRLDKNFVASDLAEVLKEWDIDVFINQMVVHKNREISEAIRLSGGKCKYLYCHHTTPNRLFNYTFTQQVIELKNKKTLKGKLKSAIILSTYPIYTYWKSKRELRRNAESYREIYGVADKFILLSNNFYDEWEKLTGIKDTGKLMSIPNMLSFEKYASAEDLLGKQKRLLVVSRLVEFPKNIKAAIDIWKKISRKNEFSEWQFDIVGCGRDEEFLREYVRKHKIERVNFLGRRDSEPYYDRSSIFVMTSMREGFGMTLIESSQKGCIPMAFESFGSVKDIIIDGQTGFLIPPYDKKEYQRKLECLMSDDEMRFSMAKNAIEHSKVFAKDNVINMWLNLIDSLK